MIIIGLEMIKLNLNYIVKDYLIMILINIHKLNLMIFHMQLLMNMQLNFGILFMNIRRIIFYSKNKVFNGQII